VSPEQSELYEHLLHLPALQMGEPSEQSELVEHWLHFPALQIGVAIGHSELAEHLLHVPPLQTGVSPEQSDALVHPGAFLDDTRKLIKNPTATETPNDASTMRIITNGSMAPILDRAVAFCWVS
jgi:hypothetical protein